MLMITMLYRSKIIKRQAFDLDITPEDSEHIHFLLTQSEWNGPYSWPSGNATPVWLDTEFVKSSE